MSFRWPNCGCGLTGGCELCNPMNYTLQTGFSPEAAPVMVVHCKRDPYDIYIGRPSKWGNPFSHKPGTLAEFRVKDRQEAIEKYREWILTRPELMSDLPSLQNKVLGCWCSPKPCHGDVLLELLEELSTQIVYVNPLDT